MDADHQKSAFASKRGVPKCPFGELYVLHFQTDDFFKTKFCGKQEKAKKAKESKESDAAKQRRTQPQGESKKRKEVRKEGKEKKEKERKRERKRKRERERREKRNRESLRLGVGFGAARLHRLTLSLSHPSQLKLTQATQAFPFPSFPYPLSIARNIFTASATLATFFTCSRRRPRTSLSSQRRRFAVA